MKNASLILNVVLLVAVIVLFVLHFTSGNSGGGSIIGGSSGSSNLKVAYVNQDTLLKYYDFVKENAGKLEATANSLGQQLNQRQQSFQKDVQDYQTGRGNLTIGQANAIEEGLQRKGQNLQLFEQQVQQQLADEQQRISVELYQKLTDYLKAYSKEKGIEIVLKFERGGDVLFAGDSLDISKEIVKGLNEAWKLDSQKKPATPADTTKKGKK